MGESDTSLFCELLQVSLGTRKGLSRVPEKHDWNALLKEAERQALVGVLFKGIELIPEDFRPSQILLLQWIGEMQVIEAQNELMTKVCEKVCQQFDEDGFYACVLKGQANYAYYPVSMSKRRNCGDIDIWVTPKKHRGHPICEVMKYISQKYKMTAHCYLHCNYIEDCNVPIEVHFRPSFMNEPIRNRRFLKFFSDFDDCVCQKKIEEGVVIPAMKPEYDVIFQMNHIYRHLIDEGVGLRQIVDYYFLLIDNGQLIIDSSAKIMRTVEWLGMKRFAGALMFVLREVLAMPEEYMLCAASEKDGKFLLNEIMLAGNFGHSDPRMGALNTGNVPSRRLSQAGRRFKRNIRFLTSYPSEVIFEPYARLWHFAWKKLGMWRY
jgi:hypothetical protein